MSFLSSTLFAFLVMLLGAIVTARGIGWEIRDQYTSRENTAVSIIGIVIESVGVILLVINGPAAPPAEVFVGLITTIGVSLFLAAVLVLAFEGFVYIYVGERENEVVPIKSADITISQIGVGVIVLVFLLSSLILLSVNAVFSVAVLIGGLFFLAPGALVRMSD